MRLTVKNLGVISKAEVDIGKDLIILTGENNTGKTYLAYLIYNLFLPFRLESEWILYDGEESNFFNGELSVNINIIPFLENMVSESLRDIAWARFAVDSEFFKELKIEFTISEDKTILKKLKEIELHETYTMEDEDEPTLHLTSTKNKGSFDIKFSIDENDYPEAAGFQIEDQIRKIALSFLPNTFIISAERNGINLFHKELSVIKNKVFDS